LYARALQQGDQVDLKKIETPGSEGNELQDFSFETALNGWLAEADHSGEKRQEAAQLIRECKRAQTTELCLNELNLTTLPDVFGSLSQLRVLDIEKNCLESLPESIGRLQNLERLLVGDNHLKSLPESIGALENLEWLTVGDNHLKSLPESIGQLKNLKGLNVAANQLESLPDSIGSLKKLEHLSIWGNKLKSYPSSMRSLPKGCWIYQYYGSGYVYEIFNLPISAAELKIISDSFRPRRFY
jgi:Leucine-rich repeat (LRR) protein